MLWILAAMGHALGNAPHPQPAPIPAPMIEVPQQVVPSDRPDWESGPEQARRLGTATRHVPYMGVKSASRTKGIKS
jgi:hypothetical protein